MPKALVEIKKITLSCLQQTWALHLTQLPLDEGLRMPLALGSSTITWMGMSVRFVLKMGTSTKPRQRDFVSHWDLTWTEKLAKMKE